MRVGRLLGALTFLLVLHLSVAAAAQMALGSKVSTAAEVGGREIPLLDGEWVVVSAEKASRSKSNKPLARAYLAQLQSGQLNRWVEIDTNVETKVGGGWARDKDVCDRNNVHFNYSDSNHNANDTACWSLNQWGETLGSNPNQASIDFYRWSDMLGRPNTSLTLSYYFTKNGDFLRVVYHFNPVLAGFADTPTAVWRGSPWHVDVASKDPKKLEYLKSLKALGERQFSLLHDVLK